MAITPLPTPPQPGDTPAEFNTNAFAWVDAIDTFTTEANALATAVDADATAAAASAVSAAGSATDAENASTAALAAANFKGNWSDLTGALNKPASVYHDNVVWMLLNNLANVTTSEPGVSADWTAISAQGGADIQTFTSSGTWTKPDGAKFVTVEVWGAGAGGGSGTRNATSTAGAGGAGGGGGGYIYKTYNASELSATETVIIGSGGAGAASVTVDSTAGSSGKDGGNTVFGSKLTVYGGVGPRGGSALPYGYPITTGSGAFGNGTGSDGYSSGFGGGSGAYANGRYGFISLFGGCGGGAGGSKPATNIGLTGGEGGGLSRAVAFSGGGPLGGGFGVNGSTASNLREGGAGGGSGYLASFQLGEEILFGNSIFASNSYSGSSYVATSSNGTTWTIKNTPRPVVYMVYDGSSFVLLCDNYSINSSTYSYDIYTTTDFVTFTYKSTKTGTANSFSYANSKYIIGFSNGTLSHSTNLTSWTDVYKGFPTGCLGVFYISGRYAIVNAGATVPIAQYSTDLSTFTNATISGSPGQFINNPSFNGSNIGIAGVSGSNAFWKTTDGITWATTTNNVASYPKATYTNGYFFAKSFGSGTTYYTSTDGATWTTTASGAAGEFGLPAFGASLYVGIARYDGGTTVAYTASTYNSTAWTTRTGTSITVAAGNGGNGAAKGGGGGGGGASLNGYASGAGGNGGNGYCVVYSW